MWKNPRACQAAKAGPGNHSIIGLAVFDRSALWAEAIGRCWSQGRLLAWLADP